MTHTLTREFDTDRSVSMSFSGTVSLHDLADIMQGWLIAQGIHYETAKRLQFVDEAEEQEGSSDGLPEAYMLGMYDGARRGVPDEVIDALRKIFTRTPAGISVGGRPHHAYTVISWLETLQPTSKPTDVSQQAASPKPASQSPAAAAQCTSSGEP